MEKPDIQRVERYLRRMFGNANIKLMARAKKKDSAEVFIGDEFIGLIFEDREDGDLSYNFQMAILDTDLEEA